VVDVDAVVFAAVMNGELEVRVQDADGSGWPGKGVDHPHREWLEVSSHLGVLGKVMACTRVTPICLGWTAAAQRPAPSRGSLRYVIGSVDVFSPESAKQHLHLGHGQVSVGWGRRVT